MRGYPLDSVFVTNQCFPGANRLVAFHVRLKGDLCLLAIPQCFPGTDISFVSTCIYVGNLKP